MKPETTLDELITAGQLARRLKRSRWGVKLTLDRLEIPPEQTLGGVSYYPAATLARLQEAMRKPNAA